MLLVMCWLCKLIGVGFLRGDRENVIFDVGSVIGVICKKFRSKSLGLGSFDILKNGNGNCRVVCIVVVNI